MAESHSTRTAYLSLDELALNHKLARRLPAELAWRFHALPLAEDKGSITVVMANPGDTVAREAIIAALGPTSCLVQGNIATIDALLAEIWENEPSPVRLAVCDFPLPVAQAVWEYAQALGELLGVQPGRLSGAGEVSAQSREEAAGHDLFVMEEPDRALLRTLLAAEERAPRAAAALITRQPRWPIRSILLVVFGDRQDNIAVEWVLRLARRSASAVTVLAVIPPAAGRDNRRTCLDEGLPALLTAEAPLGRQIRQVARRLVDEGIETTLRLRQGPLDWQIRRELADGGYDLIAAATWSGDWPAQQTGGDPGRQPARDHLLNGANCPVLLA